MLSPGSSPTPMSGCSHGPVLSEARSAFLRLEKRLAEDEQEASHAAAMGFKESLEKEGGTPIRIEESSLPLGWLERY